MSGFYTPFIPGWDCHGLPIELEVEKKLKKKEDISDKDFRDLCREYALEQVKRQKKDFKRLWEFYLTYCQEGFKAETINVYQFLIKKSK